jgi:hypothetical protein
MTTMGIENRKSPRTVLHPAQVADGTFIRDCILADISDSGAKLTIASPNEIPNDFTLLLSPSGSIRRRCRVVWRSDNQIGVEFLSDPKVAVLDC